MCRRRFDESPVPPRPELNSEVVMRRFYALGFLGVLACGLAFVARATDDEKRWTPEGAMRVIEDEKSTYPKKREAIAFLKQQKAEDFIPRLGKVIRGKYDVVALDVLYLFADFANEKAWPYIVDYEKHAGDAGENIPGKINTALIAAKDACRPKK
jgi:hypothetical protein